MNHLVAWYESIDPAGAFQPIAAVNDTSLFVTGDDIRVPSALAFVGCATGLTAAANLVGMQLQSPSLRTLSYLDLEPVPNAVVFGNPPELTDYFGNPHSLTPGENLSFHINSNPAGAEAHYGLAWLVDAPVQPVNGAIFTVRATAAASLSAGSWVNSALTFSQDLPNGNYQVVGMRARGTNLVAARLVMPGAPWRPGVPAVNAIGDLDAARFRWGAIGDMGTFEETNPPTVDCLGVTDTSQTIELDLIQV